MFVRTQQTWTAFAAYTGDWNEKINSSYWCVWRRPLHVSAGRSHRVKQAKIFRVILGQGTFSWSVSTSKITLIVAWVRNTGICTVVASCIQASQPGFAECSKTQSVRCCPFSRRVSTSKITIIAACARNTGICTVVASCIQASQPGFGECCKTQSVRCCPFSRTVFTSKIRVIAALVRGIYAVVTSCIGGTSLGPLQSLVAEEKKQKQKPNAKLKLLLRHVDILPSHGSYWSLSAPRRRLFPGESNELQYLFSSNAPMKSLISQLWERPAFMRQDVRFLDS